MSWHPDPVLATDEERHLVRRMRSGDEEAFRAFADHYIPALYRFAAARLREDRHLTRDLVSATVCKAIEKLDSYRGDAPFFTWLCACCRNEIAGHYRQRKPTVDLELAGSVSVFGAGPEEALLENESEHLVHLALDHLPPRYASALQWKYLDGLSVDEIADRMAVGLKAAESLLTRARHAFRAAYESLGGKRSAT